MTGGISSDQIEVLIKFCVKEVILKDLLSDGAGDEKVNQLKKLLGEVMDEGDDGRGFSPLKSIMKKQKKKDKKEKKEKKERKKM